MISSRRVRPENWSPIGVKGLEDNALEVVHSLENRSVIAGPGAGKTELLAQRAAYLLQTGLAPAPRRILAISFKRDAAENLASRVRRRSHPSHAERLDSMTFDAFAKGLVDRFGQSLPARWRPSADYELLNTNDRLYREFLAGLEGIPSTVGTDGDVRAILPRTFERSFLLGAPLPIDGWQVPTVGQWAAAQFWQQSLFAGNRSYLSFPMLGRLAELILRVNPTVKKALQLTYSHLFMDEFQDTTPVQYGLVREIFLGTDSVVTAVGDNKQQIMRWAMAMSDPFGVFEADFKAQRTPLYNNYRSSPELVRIQHVLAKALDTKAVEPVSKATENVDGQSCEIWNFSTPEMEARALAHYVVDQMQRRNLTPRDFVLLVRQRADDYADVLAPIFEQAGLSLRNEAGKVGEVSLQELLAEEASQWVVDLLRLAMTERSGRYWSACQETLAWLRGASGEDELVQSKLARELDAFALALQAQHPAPPGFLADAEAVVDAIIQFLGGMRLTAIVPSYRQGDWFLTVLEAVSAHLLSSSRGKATWEEALDVYEGRHAVPLMTIHKSKGLEYNTVIFVGLDDGAWWSFANDKIEATAGFFVAFTRAKQQVIFTYCRQRGAKDKIAELYALLQSAGVGSRNIA